MSEPKLLNYTTTIDAARSIAEIQAKLSLHGVRRATVEYEAGVPTSLTFTIPWHGEEVSFRLPANVVEVQRRMERTAEPRFHGRAQAARVAWRILKDWTEAQVALIETGMVKTEEVFLPYMVVEGASFFEYINQTKRLALMPPELARS